MPGRLVAAPLLTLVLDMRDSLVRSTLGFSLIELLVIVVMIATLAGIALPVYNDLAEASRLSAAARDVERELQIARLRAVQANRSLRVRLNCPVAGQYRTVEVLGTSADTAGNRCSTSSYPFPAPDADPFTLPNLDGPLRYLSLQTTVSNAAIEFRPNGTAWDASSGTASAITGDLTITVTRRARTRTVTVNGLGKITLQ
jgi:Tfp pilus assembly protein FimT